MATKIKSLTIINQQGSKSYFVGDSYDGLLLQRIEDKSVEYPDAIETIYMGFTQNGDIVFEVINAPIEVQYQEA